MSIIKALSFHGTHHIPIGRTVPGKKPSENDRTEAPIGTFIFGSCRILIYLRSSVSRKHWQIDRGPWIRAKIFPIEIVGIVRWNLCWTSRHRGKIMSPKSETLKFSTVPQSTRMTKQKSKIQFPLGCGMPQYYCKAATSEHRTEVVAQDMHRLLSSVPILWMGSPKCTKVERLRRAGRIVWWAHRRRRSGKKRAQAPSGEKSHSWRWWRGEGESAASHRNGITRC